VTSDAARSGALPVVFDAGAGAMAALDVGNLAGLVGEDRLKAMARRDR